MTRYDLKFGPGNESLFDCLRLGDWEQMPDRYRWMDYETDSGRHIKVAITGLHRGVHNTDWFFYGHECMWLVPNIHTPSIKEWRKPDEGEYAFGRWNAHIRKGQIIFGSTSFFVSPLTLENTKA